MRAVTAFLALGRLRSHPRPKTSLRARLPTHQRQTDRNEHTGAAEQEIRPKGRPRKKPNHVLRLFSPELSRRQLFPFNITTATPPRYHPSRPRSGRVFFIC